MINAKFKQSTLGNVASEKSGSIKSTNDDAHVIAKYDYHSQGQEELSIQKGEKLKLIDDSRHWWKVSNRDGATGFVPSNYVKRQKHSLFDSIKRNIRVGSSKKAALSNLITSSANNKTSPSNSPLISTGTSDECKNEHDSNSILNILPSHNSNNSKPTRPEPPNAITKFQFNNNHLEHQQSAKQKKQMKSHSDILLQELGADFNGFCASPVNSSYDNNIRESSSSNNAHINSTGDGKVRYAIIKYTYNSNQTDELSLSKGSRVKVLEKSDDGWWRGELGNQVGWFPSNYVIEEAEDNTNTTNAEHQTNVFKNSDNDKKVVLGNGTSSGNNKLATKERQTFSSMPIDDDDYDALFVVVALYQFQAQNFVELSMTKDEYFDIIEQPQNDPDWWRARNHLGECGLVPKNYVEVVPDMKSIQVVKQPTSTSCAMTDGYTNSVYLGSKKTSCEKNNEDLSSVDQKWQQKNSNTKEKTSAIDTSIFDHLMPNSSNNNSHNNKDMSLRKLASQLADKLQLNDKIWYHGVMSRPQCDQLLNAYADDGDFLIRNSETSAGDFSVSIKAPSKNKHFRVNHMDSYFCIGQRRFESLDELIEHYKRTPIYTSSEGEKMFLRKPYPR